MKKIFINVKDIDEEKLFERFKEICTEEFKEFKLQVGERIHILEDKKTLESKPEIQNTFDEIEIHGWKGESSLEIKEQENDFLLIEHRKSKSTGDIVESKHLISRENVEELWDIILENLPVGEIYTSKYLVRKLIQKHGWSEKEGLTEDQLLNAFWSGTFRAKYYFGNLYYPLKILENKNYITYSGSGNVIRNTLMRNPLNLNT